MIHVRAEGEKIYNGFNFYPLLDKGSAGVVVKLDNLVLWLRYSKITGKFICQKSSTI